MDVPSVLASAWKASDGTVAIFLTNISDKPVTLQYTFDPEHSLGTKTFVMKRLGDQHALPQSSADPIEIKLKPLSVFIHQFAPAA